MDKDNIEILESWAKQKSIHIKRFEKHLETVKDDTVITSIYTNLIDIFKMELVMIGQVIINERGWNEKQ